MRTTSSVAAAGQALTPKLLSRAAASWCDANGTPSEEYPRVATLPLGDLFADLAVYLHSTVLQVDWVVFSPLCASAPTSLSSERRKRAKYGALPVSVLPGAISALGGLSATTARIVKTMERAAGTVSSSFQMSSMSAAAKVEISDFIINAAVISSASPTFALKAFHDARDQYVFPA